MKLGKILGIVGGLIVIISMFLPWMTVSSNIESISLMGILIIPFSTLALIFAILGLIFVAVGKKGLCIGALVMGILAIVMIGISFALMQWIADMTTIIGTGITSGVDYGVWLAMIGSIILIIGSVLAYGEAKKAQPAPAPMPMTPPPIQ